MLEENIKRRLLNERWQWQNKIKQAEERIRNYNKEISALNKEIETLEKENVDFADQLRKYADIISKALINGIYVKELGKKYRPSLEADSDGFVLVVYEESFDFNATHSDEDWDTKIEVWDRLPISDYKVSWAFSENEIEEDKEEVDEYV